MRGTCQPVVNLHCNLSKYGIVISTYEAMATAQDHECAICRTPEAQTGERLLLDHDHVTGKVRGLLCRNCNTGLARFKDSTMILQNAFAYMQNALYGGGHDLTDIKRYLPRS